MYTCCMCKKTMQNEPAMENNAGKFCEKCKGAVHTRA